MINDDKTSTWTAGVIDEFRFLSMEELNRRSALVLGVATAAASALVIGGSTVVKAAVGDETVVGKGVKLKVLGEGQAMIPGYKTVRLRDMIFEPGGMREPSTMPNAMVCHIVQDGKTFTAKKGFVWTCAAGTKEGAKNTSSAIAVMRITDLLTA